MDSRLRGFDPQKFWHRVALDDGCWLWTGHVNKVSGYGQISVREGGKVHTIQGHRLAYELLVGEIPNGLEIDHLCRVRSCVRPDHLEAVDHRTNVMRGDSPAGRAMRSRAA